MLKNYLVVALRNLRRQKGYALLNVTGLAVGMACCLAILLYVYGELSYDQHHANKDRIVRLAIFDEEASYGGGDPGLAKVPGPWGPTVLNAVPQVETMTRFRLLNSQLFERGDVQAYEAGGLFADGNVFDVFSFEFVQGDATTALTEPNTMVLTETLAARYFGEADPVGQSLVLNNDETYRVTGILKDPPTTSHFSFSYLISLASDTSEMPTLWNRTQFYTYLLLDDAADLAESEAVITEALQAQNPAEGGLSAITPHLQPLTEIYLHSDLHREIGPTGDLGYVSAFAVLALLVLLMAVVNFVNLTTARSARRATEVGVRKAIGAPRTALARQFIGEALLLIVLSLGLALLLTQTLLPSFNQLAGVELTLPIQEPVFWLALLVAGFGIGVLAGSYPAFVLSRFRPARVLKGAASATGGAWLRRSLVVVQFTVSVFLLVAVGVVQQQVRFIESADLGFQTEQIVTIPVRDQALTERLGTLKEALLQHPGVVDVTASGNLPGGGDWGIPFTPSGVPDDEVPEMRMLVIDPDFLDTFEMEIVAGRGFSEDFATDSSTYLVSETAVRALGWDDPFSETIAMPAIDRPVGAVVGVVKDFHYRSLRETVEPIMLFIPPPGWLLTVSVRIRPGEVEETLAALEATWATFDPAHPFTYSFFDETFNHLYRAEARTSALARLFAALAVLIACLGLFGLAAFAAEQRTKEIGVRKVLGASVGSVIALLSKDFVRLVLIGFVVATPLAWLAMSRWLDGFAYRVDLGPGVFVVAGLAALAIALVTVSTQALRAATTDPVKALRYE